MRAASVLLKIAAGVVLLVLALLLVLELRLSGPTGISGYVAYRTLRIFVRNATIPDPPRIDGFSNEGPNVVIIVLDCYRYDYVERASPHLRRFGEQGWWYDQYYAAASWTKPSTASLFTGLHVRKHFVIRGGGTRLPVEALTLAELMSQQGLATAGFVWNPHLTRRQGFDQGFDHYVDRARRGSKSLLYEFFSWLDGERPDRFFAYIHFQGTHDPYYDDNDLFGLLSAPPYEGDIDFSDVEYKFDVQNGLRLTPDQAAHLQHVGEAKARRVDREAVAAFLERFEASGLADNTMLVITSDHGDAFAEHGAVSHGETVYNEEIRVPLMIRFPPRLARERSFPQSGRASCPASTVDLLPTALDFVGAPIPPEIDGVSLVPRSGGEVECAEAVIAERTSGTEGILGAALVSRDRKLLVDYGDDGRKQLFDLSADPGEQRDLSRGAPSETAALDGELTRRLNDDGSSMAPWAEASGDLPDAEKEALRALGYLD